MTETKKNPNSALRLIVVLFLISALTALALGLVNYVTAPVIAELTAEKTASAMAEVLPAEAYTEVSFTDDTGLVTAVSEATDSAGAVIGHVVQVSPSGFGGAISMMVGVDESGAVTGIAIVEHDETSGLGANAAASSDVGLDFRAQFVGATGSVAVTKDGGSIDALTGATVTSRAVCNGVNAALAVLGFGA